MSDIVIREIRNRNKEVFRDFFKNNYGDLVAYANSYLFDIAASEDLVQEIFIYLWENANEICITSSLKAYLKKAVRNRCLNYLRSIDITDDLKVLEMNAHLNNYHEDWDSIQEDERAIICNQLLKFIDTLPEKMREIVKMRFFEEYSYKEIADELGVSVNTVKTQLRRARTKIMETVTVLIILLQDVL